MSVQPLHQFFGRSVVDPGVREAFDAGSITSVLRQCGFANEAAEELGALPAESFDQFLVALYHSVLAKANRQMSSARPLPTTDLAHDPQAREKRDEAA
jgi:hypothetical protein